MNIDAFAEGDEMSFRAQNIAAYTASKQGIRDTFDLMSESTKHYRKLKYMENQRKKTERGSNDEGALSGAQFSRGSASDHVIEGADSDVYL